MRIIICDLCDEEFEDREDIFTFNPVKADRNRGARRIDVCTSCIPFWMLDEEDSDE